MKESSPERKSLRDSFFETETAKLDPQVHQFMEKLDKNAQHLSGSYPSLYGGTVKGSRTASEYSMTKEGALERLNIKYRMAAQFVGQVIEKAVEAYAGEMNGDEMYAERQGDSFQNEVINQQAVQRRTGEVEVEGGSHVPLSWSQIKATIVELLTSGNESMAMALNHPQNSTLMKNVLGVDELYIPGENSRNKQLVEIAEMLEQQPTQGPVQVPGGQPQLISSVPAIAGIDNDEIELETCKVWLASPKGLEMRKTNPAGYQNVIAHAQQHLMNIMGMQQADSSLRQKDREDRPNGG